MKKIILHLLRTLLFAIRPIINEKQYTVAYTRILQLQGVDIASYDKCGFIAPNVYFDGLDRSRIHIGRNVYLTYGLILLTHDRSPVIKALIQGVEKTEALNEQIMLQDIWIGDNVYIGMNSIVLPGTKISNNVVIGAGSIVKGKLESGYVYAGSPARKIKPIDEVSANSAWGKEV